MRRPYAPTLTPPEGGDFPAYVNGTAQVYITADGGQLCAACANGGNGSRCDARLDPWCPDDDQWRVIEQDDAHAPGCSPLWLACDHCHTFILMPRPEAL